MKLLITPAEVVALAFASDSMVRPTQIIETEILAAQQKYFVPVFGDLFAAMLQGDYADLASEWIKPSLAEFVKSRTVMTLGAVTASGVVLRNYDGASTASAQDRLRVSREAYERAKIMRAQALKIVESAPADYPEYDANSNILNKTRLASGIIL